MEQIELRDNSFLEGRLNYIWQTHFSDITRLNVVTIRFGRKSASRLGSIVINKLNNIESIITLTGYFKDSQVPTFVIDSTIAHELVHYTHGFHSPYPQRYKYPHKGKIVEQELSLRGLIDQLGQQQSWLKENWPHITKRRRIRRRLKKLRFSFKSLFG